MLEAGVDLVHPDLGDTLGWERLVDAGDVDLAFAGEGVTIVERRFRFGHHTGITLESRAAVCALDPSEGMLTMHSSDQAPHMMQAILAKHLDLAEENVRVVSNDVRGSFGIKIQTYGDEIATAVAARLLGRPVKFVADRQANFLTDIHARDDVVTGRMGLAELARTAHYRDNQLPPDLEPELIATRHDRVSDSPFVFTSGAMTAQVEVDAETGFVKVLGFRAVEDRGRVINPMPVVEQVRGGGVQGIGGALHEKCVYNAAGSLLTTTMAGYMVPMDAEMPDIVVAHVETPTKTSVLGAKGAGEAGTDGAPGAVMNAVNDALAPLDASIWQMPMTPERTMRALGRL